MKRIRPLHSKEIHGNLSPWQKYDKMAMEVRYHDYSCQAHSSDH